MEKGALCSMLWSVSEEHVCALPRPLSPAASAKWIKKKPLLGSALELWPLTKKMKSVLSKLHMHPHMQIYTRMPPTHMHILHRSMRSALEGFPIEVSIMTDTSFLFTGMNSNPFLFPLWLWPLTSLAMSLDGSLLWSYPSSLIEFILSLSFAGVFERPCFSSLTRGRQAVCVCLRNVSPAFTLLSTQLTPHLLREKEIIF